MVEGEKKYRTKLLSLLRITKFTMKGFKIQLLINEIAYNCLTKNDYNRKNIKTLQLQHNHVNAILKGVRAKKMLRKAFELMDRMIVDACSPPWRF